MSDKPKRKTKPKRRSAKLIASITVIILLIFVAFIMNWQSHRNTEPPTPDYAATATQIIVDATQTAIAYENDGCERVDITRWLLIMYIDVNAEIDIERSSGSNTQRSNLRCNDGYRFEHLEYFVPIYVDTGDIDFASIIDDVVVFLEDYPPDNVPPLPPLMNFSIIQSPTSMGGERFSMDYTEMMDAFDSGLRGSELLEAVATPIE